MLLYRNPCWWESRSSILEQNFLKSMNLWFSWFFSSISRFSKQSCTLSNQSLSHIPIVCLTCLHHAYVMFISTVLDFMALYAAHFYFMSILTQPRINLIQGNTINYTLINYLDRGLLLNNYVFEYRPSSLIKAWLNYRPRSIFINN